MTTARTPAAAAVVIDDMEPADGFRGYILIPLVEFGQSLDNPDLDTWFEAFAERNKDTLGDFEITAQGELKIMPPTGFPGDLYEAEMSAEAVLYARVHGGMAGGPTSRFHPARWGPAWPGRLVAFGRTLGLPRPEDTRTPPFVSVIPDFVAEIVSPSNRGPEVADKVRRYLEGGARLIWVIHPRNRTVAIYRPDQETGSVLQDPEALDGGDVLPGFAFNVRERIFDNVP